MKHCILLLLTLLCATLLLSCGSEHTHTLIVCDAKKATCTADGYTAYEECSTCDYTTRRDIPAKGHSYPATYTVTSREHSRTCTACGDVERAEHTYDEGRVTREPTCKTQGQRTVSCTVCAHSRTVTMAGLGEHVYKDSFTVFDTYHANVCDFCGDAVSAQHTWEQTSRTEAVSCLTPAVSHEACVCGAKRDRTLPVEASLHTPGAWETVVSAGAITAGLEAKFCTLCGTTLEERTVGSIAQMSMPALYITGEWQKATKTRDVTVAVRYDTPSGEGFEGYATIHWQGATSANYPKKNYTMKLYKDEYLTEKQKVNLGWGKENKYCLKANWVDCTQARNIVACRLWADVVETRPASALRDRLVGLKTNAGAIDGFPIVLYMNGEFHGLYTLNVPKDEWMLGMDDVECEAILGAESWETDFSEELGDFYLDQNGDWKANGGAWEMKYFGTEKTTGDTTWVKNSFNALIRFARDTDGDAFRAGIDRYLDVDATIDYILFMYAIYMRDNSAKNILWATYDGSVWFPTVYDQDGTFGMAWDGIREAPPTGMLPKVVMQGNGYIVQDGVNLGSSNVLISKLLNLYPERVLTRYAELRASVLTEEHILAAFDDFLDGIPEQLCEADRERWPNVPSWDIFERDYIAAWIPLRLAAMDEVMIDIYNKVCRSSLGE